MKFPTLPVDLLDDGLIECGDYPDWPTARHEIKRFPDDRRILNELLASLPEEGLLEPLTLRVRRRSPHVLLSDGHHRAVALMELGIREFTYRWHWCGPYDGIKYRSTPLPQHITEYLELSRA
jgi:hypothetical protein